ncbi:MAG: cupin domain-containing protein [Gemmatimonadota bacterium]|nr:MAG: cupin domain-containing protein [Gemmatimonadota bacterium]
MNVKHLDEIPIHTVTMHGAEGVKVRRLISDLDGAEHFAMRLFELEPGGHTPLHTHDWEHEIYILDGTGIVHYEGQDYPMTSGTVLLVPGGKEHRFRNTGQTPLRFLCIVPLRGDV